MLPIELHHHLPHGGVQRYKRWLPVLVRDRHGDHSLFLLLKEAQNRFQDQVSGQDLSSTTIYWGYLLSSEDASTTDSLDLLLRDPAEEPGDGVHDENRLPGHQVQPRFSWLQVYDFQFCTKKEGVVVSPSFNCLCPYACSTTLKTLATPSSLA